LPDDSNWCCAMIRLSDWNLIDSLQVSEVKTGRFSKKSDAFIALCVSSILGITMDDAEATITDGGNDCGIDAVFVSEDDARPVAHIFNCHAFADIERAQSKTYPSREVPKICQWLSLAASGSEVDASLLNQRLLERTIHFREIAQDPFSQITIHFCSNGNTFAAKDLKRANDQLSRITKVDVFEWGHNDLLKLILNSRRKKVSRSLKLFADQNFERSDGSIRGVIGTVKVGDLLSFLSSREFPSIIDEDLFYDNVRVYLGQSSEVNSNIIRTASGENYRDLWYLNNGITLVCDRFRYRAGVDDPEVYLENVQIVNGGQTSHSLFLSSRLSESNVRNSFILVRIYETEDEDIKLRVAEATNTQKRINSRDLKSNDAKLRLLELDLRARGYFFERKKSLHVNEAADKRIDALRAGQLLLAYYIGEPDKAKTKSDEIFGQFYGTVFSEKVDADAILCVFGLARFIDEQRVEAKKKSRLRGATSISENFIIEGFFHILYTIKLICDKKGIDPFDFPRAQEFVSESISIVDRSASSFRHLSYYRFFRSVDAKLVIQKEILGDFALRQGILPL
jgi:hypothetical protein